MLTPSLVSKLLLRLLAGFFAAATILYSGLWIYSNTTRGLSGVELGFNGEYISAGQYQFVKSVTMDSPAEKAGLRYGDRILKADGQPFESEYTLTEIWAKHRPGDPIVLTVQRPPEPTPFLLHGVFRGIGASSSEGGLTRHLGQDIINAFPISFLVVGLVVLFLRLKDPNAWLLALMFSGSIALPDFPNSWQGLTPSVRVFAMIYRGVFNSLNPALFYFFFAIFPTGSPIDRRVPWLKWVGLLLAIPLFGAGGQRAPAVVVQLWGEQAANLVRFSYSYTFIGLGLLSLVTNALGAQTPESRRKIRVILWGTLAGVVPVVLAFAAQDFLGFHMSLWLAAVVVLLLYLFPLSFAYAVVRHRVLEIPVLLQRGARYLLVQRGFTILLAFVSVGVTLAFALFFARYLEPLTRAAVPGGIALGTAFGTLLLWTGTMVHKGVGVRIDRAFFRNSYDARTILEDLVERARTATNRSELAALIEQDLNQALHPSSLAVYLETSDNQLCAARGSVPPELECISSTAPKLVELARHGRPREVTAQWLGNAPEAFILAPLRPDCLVPILGRDSRLIGLLVLGPRLSEEPYSREDKHLLTSVASQAGMALETVRLGEKIAERIEAERRAAQEMEYAKQVQARLFPQKFPRLETLEYAGGCTQARQVGGDYYDFLELRPGRMAMVLADIAGKGISGALLMANLQANLRSQYAAALDDLPRLLWSVNQLFYENTSDTSYATLFFGDYDDSTRQMRYANCGHLPPLLLRASSSPKAVAESRPLVERLEATSTVLGLFEKWECTVAEAQLGPGDTLVLFTDGVTEAENEAGEEFGESRLIDVLASSCELRVSALLESIVAAVKQFSGSEQADDITLVVARCRA